MILIKRLLLIFLMIVAISGYSQSVSRVKQISPDSISFHFDTLSIIPNSIVVTLNYLPVDISAFKIDYFSAKFTILDSILLNKPIVINYQVFDIYLTKPFFHKDRKLIEENRSFYLNEFAISDKSNLNPWMENASELKKAGSITRGISIGNKQDVVVNSDLNLQLDGVIFDDFMIKAVISDKNIPIQPEGNTQQLQEFDKVFIQLNSKSTKIIAGDFDLVAPASNFLKANKKVLGAMVDYSHQFADSSSISTSSSFAVTKGKFARINLVVIDGNQGPYKLIPLSGDANIVVLGGSERVFLNGVLLKRGTENDYSVDYNLGEIVFSPNIIVAQESKIVVEFEYSDRHYSRSLFTNFNQWTNKKFEVALNIYSEQDMKNQSIQPELSTEQKNILRNAGNNQSLMITPAFDSVAYNPNQIRYKLVDSLVNGVHYDSVFVYSSVSDSAYYALSFTNVGPNNGDYMILNNTINGRVFVWIAPKNGLHQGMYNPIYILIPPQKKQMITSKIKYKLSQNSEFNVEFALSNYDKNSFASIEKQNDIGAAITSSYQHKFFLFPHKFKSNPFIFAKISHQYIGAYFSEIEPSKNSEFFRQFNVDINSLNTPMNLISTDVLFDFLKFGKANYVFNYLDFKSKYTGSQHVVNLKSNSKFFDVETQGLSTHTNGSASNSNYSKLSQLLKGKSTWGNLGAKYDMEYNSLTYIGLDSMAPSSLKLHKYELFIENPDSLPVNYKLWYNVKQLSTPSVLIFNQFSKTSEQGLLVKYMQNKHSLSINSIYREVIYNANINLKNDYALIANLTYQGTLFKGVITLNTFYQTATGQEQKKEYQYLKVAKGQGVYIWTDFNNNNVEEIDEFSVAPYSDQGEYVRLWVLTNSYTKVIINEFNQIIMLNPAAAITSKGGVASVLSKLKNQTSLFLNNKTTDGPEIGANPFSYLQDDQNNIASSRSIRNNLSLNQSDPLWNIEYVFNNQYNKLFLTSGYENKSQQSNSLILRSALFKKIMIKIDCGRIEKKSTTEILLNRNYQIVNNYIEPALSYLRSSNFRIGLSYKYSEKNASSIPSINKAFFNQANFDLQYNLPKRGVIASKFSFINVQFVQNENSPLTLEILQGLSNGKNFTYSLSFQTVISKNIQLNSNYELRISSSNTVVQNGNISIRAFF